MISNKNLKPNIKKRSIRIFSQIFIFSFFFISLVSQFAVAVPGDITYNQTAGLVQVNTSELAVKITASGTVPHFHFWNPNPNTNDIVDYHVMFLRIFEAQSDDGTYNKDEDRLIGVPMALPASNWELSEFDVEVESIHFNFTTKLAQLYIQIRVHLYAANPEELKFDLIVSGWDWQQEDSLLVFQFTVSQSAHEQDQENEQDQERGKPTDFDHVGNEFQFGEGYMGYAEEAQAGNIPVSVGGSSNNEGEDGIDVYLSFEYFGEETLVYDPTIGISAVSDEEETVSDEEETVSDEEETVSDEEDTVSDGTIEIIGTPVFLIGLIGVTLIALVIIIYRIRIKN